MTDTRRTVRFYLNDDFLELSALPPERTVLEFLRREPRLRGTKEGCAEGDCGACTVLVGRIDGGGALRYEAVNTCIRFLATLDGTHLVTVEHLARSEERLHPAQQAMVDANASQCGFCTPGFVMSLYALWLATPHPTTAEVEQALQGNLCRCTGYSPIIQAAKAISDYGNNTDDPLRARHDEMRDRLLALRDDNRVDVSNYEGRSILPASADDLAAVLEAEPDSTIVSGATDVGLWATKQLRELPTMVFLDRVRELSDISVAGGRLVLGARVSYSDASDLISEHFPGLVSVWSRIGGAQVRNAGTIGGNIANGSPIGDTPPPLIALGAELTLRKGGTRRKMLLENFFIDYGRQDLLPCEFVETISIPLLDPSDRFAVYKVSKRFDEDISAVLGAFCVRIEAGRVVKAVIAFGGMAAIPKRARAVESALIDQAWSRATVECAMNAFEQDFSPLTDWRASSEYRMLVSRNLLLRFWAETEGQHETQVRAFVDG